MRPILQLICGVVIILWMFWFGLDTFAVKMNIIVGWAVFAAFLVVTLVLVYWYDEKVAWS